MENKTIKFSAIEEHAEWLGKFAHLACKVNSSSGTIDFYGLTQEQVELLNTGAGGSGWQLNPRTGLVDVGGSFDCGEQGLSDFKRVRFGEVRGNFYCGYNHLTTLEGAPREVGGTFDCSYNQLSSLEGAPEKVGGYFYCEDNQLTSLEGAPREVGGSFYCKNLCGGSSNPVSVRTLERIFRLMKKGKSYLEAVESLWEKIPAGDQILLYRPGFKWVTPEKKRAAELIIGYNRIKEML